MSFESWISGVDVTKGSDTFSSCGFQDEGLTSGWILREREAGNICQVQLPVASFPTWFKFEFTCIIDSMVHSPLRLHLKGSGIYVSCFPE